MTSIQTIHRFVAAIAITAAAASTATADWHDFWHRAAIDYHRNNAWPEPFAEADAAQVIAPFEVMKQNGWRLHNTIGHALFREGDGALMASGGQMVQWVATQAPASRRAIFVLRGRTNEETDARVASVKQTLANTLMRGPAPPIYITDVDPASSSGAWAMKINRSWIENLPTPELPRTSVQGQSGALAN